MTSSAIESKGESATKARVSASPEFGSTATAIGRLLVYLSLTIVCMPLQALAVSMNWRLRKTLPLWYHGKTCRILGLTIETRGTVSKVHPTLFVANHVSYFDIEVLGALLPVSFVAKAEVANWPLFGWLAKLQQTVFVERRAGRTRHGRDGMTARIEAGDDLVLFPEGTSGDGNWVLPFKSALFSVAEQSFANGPLQVQPVSITYTKLDGLPMGRYLRPLFAWYGDMNLGGHLWHALRMGLVTVEVEFHPPVTIGDFQSRKQMSEHCQRLVSDGVSAALAGRAGT